MKKYIIIIQIKIFVLLKQNEYFGQNKQKKEQIIILTNNNQINLLKEVYIIFVDGTFKSSQGNFYQ